MGAEYQERHSEAGSLGEAVAAMLADRYPQHTAKLVARDLGCAVKTALNILDGHLSGRTATMLIRAYGPGFIAEAAMAAAGTNLITYIRSQAEEARAAATRHESQAHELSQLEAALRSSRHPHIQGELGLHP